MGKDPSGFEIWTPNLGSSQGALSDWVTQRWVQFTGRDVSWNQYPWLETPVGDVDCIGTDFFHRLATRKGLTLVTDGPPRGLVDNFSCLEGPACVPGEVAPAVVKFYEQTSNFDFDVWSKWCGVFRPFGGLLAAIFSKRLQQLNVPLSTYDTRLGITSQVLKLKNQDGTVTYTAWVREVVSTKRTLYAGSYSICTVPGYAGPCIKVAFPLPNGAALVIMRPESYPDGSFSVHSEGKRFGDPGFYFYVESQPGQGWARYLTTLKESIHVYYEAEDILRANHELKIWGQEFLRLHYRMQTR